MPNPKEEQRHSDTLTPGRHRGSRLRRDLVEQSPEHPSMYQRSKGIESKQEGEDMLMGDALKEAHKREKWKSSKHPLLRRFFDI